MFVCVSLSSVREALNWCIQGRLGHDTHFTLAKLRRNTSASIHKPRRIGTCSVPRLSIAFFFEHLRHRCVALLLVKPISWKWCGTTIGTQVIDMPVASQCCSRYKPPYQTHLTQRTSRQQRVYAPNGLLAIASQKRARSYLSWLCADSQDVCLASLANLPGRKQAVVYVRRLAAKLFGNSESLLS